MTTKGPVETPQDKVNKKSGWWFSSWFEKKADSWYKSFKGNAYYKNLAKVFFYGLFFISLLALPGLGPLIAKGIGGIFNILPFKAVGEISGIVTNVLMTIGTGFWNFLGILGKNTTDAFVLLGVTTAGSLVGSKITWSAQNKLDADVEAEEKAAQAAKEQKEKDEEAASKLDPNSRKMSASQPHGRVQAAAEDEDDDALDLSHQSMPSSTSAGVGNPARASSSLQPAPASSAVGHSVPQTTPASALRTPLAQQPIPKPAAMTSSSRDHSQPQLQQGVAPLQYSYPPDVYPQGGQAPLSPTMEPWDAGGERLRDFSASSTTGGPVVPSAPPRSPSPDPSSTSSGGGSGPQAQVLPPAWQPPSQMPHYQYVPGSQPPIMDQQQQEGAPHSYAPPLLPEYGVPLSAQPVPLQQPFYSSQHPSPCSVSGESRVLGAVPRPSSPLPQPVSPPGGVVVQQVVQPLPMPQGVTQGTPLYNHLNELDGWLRNNAAAAPDKQILYQTYLCRRQEILRQYSQPLPSSYPSPPAYI